MSEGCQKGNKLSILYFLYLCCESGCISLICLNKALCWLSLSATVVALPSLKNSNILLSLTNSNILLSLKNSNILLTKFEKCKKFNRSHHYNWIFYSKVYNNVMNLFKFLLSKITTLLFKLHYQVKHREAYMSTNKI